MFRFLLLWLALIPFAHGQAPTQSVGTFAGCYEVTSLSWMPQDGTIKLIPQRFELLTTFRMHSLPRHLEPSFENSWTWSPNGKNNLKIFFNNGLGGFKGKLVASGNGEFVGKLKEWCDSRCGFKKRTGNLHIRSTACESQ